MKHLSAAWSKEGRRVKFIVVGLAVVIMASGALLYRGYTYVQHDARFCRSCHTMEEPFQKWSESAHHLVTCHECHQQPLSASLYQAWYYLTRHPERVTHHPTLNHEVCAKCHLSDDPQWKLISETAGHKIHFTGYGIDCLDCHMGGVHEFLRPVESCMRCHVSKVKTLGEKMAFVHCTDCHQFLADRPSLTPTRESCLECHLKTQVGEETFPEAAPMASLECGTCHKPHETLRPDREVCLACHPDAAPPHHTMQKDSSCTGCHKPHQWTAQ